MASPIHQFAGGGGGGGSGLSIVKSFVPFTKSTISLVPEFVCMDAVGVEPGRVGPPFLSTGAIVFAVCAFSFESMKVCTGIFVVVRREVVPPCTGNFESTCLFESFKEGV
jgi:hypothetical protein